MQAYQVRFPTGRTAYVETDNGRDAAFTLAQDALPDVPVPATVTAIAGIPDSQKLFEGMFSRVPQVDTRTPKDIRNGVTL